MDKVSLDVGLNVGGLISGAAQGERALRDLQRAIDEALKKEDLGLYGKLGTMRDALQTSLSQFGRDSTTLQNDPMFKEYLQSKAAGKDTSKFEADPEFMAGTRKINDNLEKLTAALDGVTEAVQKGDFDRIQQSVTGANQSLDAFHQKTAEVIKPDAAQTSLLKTIVNQQSAQFIAQSVDKIVASFDRSAIVARQGAGDITGGAIDEQRRSASLYGGFAEAAGTGLGLALAPITGGLSVPAGMLAGKIPGWIMNANANDSSTKNAYSELWEDHIPGAMELNALLGKDGDSANIRSTFASAADAAAAFGFSSDEGIEAVKRGTGEGLSERDAIAAATRAFSFERGVGADRQLALGFESRARRFGMDDALGWAYRGSQAGGMAPGQFNEFLRSMERVFEDGIGKGFARGTKDIAENFAYLSMLTDNNELYKGEHGAKITQSIGAGIEGASAVKTPAQILAYRAAQEVVAGWKANAPDEYKKLHDVDGDGNADITRTTDNIDTTLLLDRGFTPEVFNGIMKNFDVAGRGSLDEVDGLMKSLFGLTTTQTSYLYNRYKDNGAATLKDYKNSLEMRAKDPPSGNSKELDFTKLTEAFKNKMAMYGADAFETKLAELPGKIAEAERKAEEATGGASASSKPVEMMSHNETQAEYIAALKSGDFDRAKALQARAEEITTEATGYVMKFGMSTGDLFDARNKDDKEASKLIKNTLRGGISDMGGEEYDAAKEALVMFERVSKNVPKATLEKMNKDDVFNSLAGNKTAQELLGAFRALIESNNALNEEMKKGILIDG